MFNIFFIVIFFFKAIINGLYTDENNQKLNIGHAVKAIALDPNYHKSGSGRKFIIGGFVVLAHF